MTEKIAIGADIGGSHISSAAVDLVKGVVLKETLSERSVNNKGSASEIISVWSSCLRETVGKLSSRKIAGIGFAMPGPFDYVKGISYIKGVAKYENLYGFNIGDAISSTMRLRSDTGIRFMNDASSFAVGEAWAGKGAGYSKIMCITLGTGLGSAFVADRIPVVDGPEVPKIGCVYHLPYKDGIADDYFSTRWFTGSYKKITGQEINGVKELSAMADSNREVADLFMTFGIELGKFLAPWIKKFGAEVLVIGGNISFAWNRFGNYFNESLKNEGCSCKTELSVLKEDAALLGSAYLFDDYFWKAVQPALPLM